MKNRMPTSQLVGIVAILILTLLSMPLPSMAARRDDFFKMGIEEFRKEDYEEALEFFEKAYKENPKDSAITLYLGLTHREIQNYPEAVRFFKETLTLSPEAGDVRFLLADVLYGIGSYEEALGYIETAIKEGVRPARSNYLKGLILARLKKGRDAVEAFKKAKELDPSLTQQADFQIATVYLQEREFKKAKEVFKGLITVDPTSDWALFSKDYLTALEKLPPPYRLIIDIGLQYDTNVLGVPIDEALVDVTKQEDWKRQFTLLGEYTPYTKGPWDIKTSYNLNLTQYNEKDYPKTTPGRKVPSQDIVAHTFSIMPSYNRERWTAGLLLSYSYLEVDYTRYMDTLTANPSITFLIKGNHLGQAFLKFKSQEHNFEYVKIKYGGYSSVNEDRDADNFSGGLAYLYTFKKGKGLFNTRIEGEKSDADGRNWDYEGVKVSAGLLYPFIDNRLKLNLYGEWYYQDFSNIHTIYKRKRRDETITLQTTLTYNIISPLDVKVGYAYIGDDSNIGVYEYRKDLYTVGMEYRF